MDANDRLRVTKCGSRQKILTENLKLRFVFNHKIVVTGNVMQFICMHIYILSDRSQNETHQATLDNN